MNERITTVTDERMVFYSREFKKALELEKNIKRNMQEGEGTIYFTIHDKTGSHSSSLKIGNDLLKIAQGAAFGAYCDLVYVTIPFKKTGEEVRVINPVGKAIADGIISEYAKVRQAEGGI